MGLLVQVIELIGALAVLVPFTACQFRRMHSGQLSYVLLNLIGSAILTVVALIERQWGFFLIDVVWALVSLWTTVRMYLRRASAADNAADTVP